MFNDYARKHYKNNDTWKRKHFLSWESFLLIYLNKYYFSHTSKISSIGLGTQKGFVSNPVLAPPPESMVGVYS